MDERHQVGKITKPRKRALEVGDLGRPPRNVGGRPTLAALKAKATALAKSRSMMGRQLNKATRGETGNPAIVDDKIIIGTSEIFLRELDAICERENRYRSDVVREAIRDWMTRYYEQAAATARYKKELGLD